MSFSPLSGAPISAAGAIDGLSGVLQVVCTATAEIFQHRLDGVCWGSTSARGVLSAVVFDTGLIYYDGFDDYTDFKLHWDNAPTSALSTAAAAARTGTSGLKLTYNIQETPTLYKYIPNTTACIIGLAYRFPVIVSQENRILAFLNSSTVQTDVRIKTDGTLVVTRNGTVLSTGTTTLATSTWYYLEFKTVCHGSTGSYELRINNQLEVSASSVNTQGAGSNIINRIALLPTQQYQVEQHIDDLYVVDATVDGSDFLGSCRVDTLLPDAAGDLSQFTRSGGSFNYEMVDDAANDGDTTYNSSTVSGYSDLFYLSDLAAGGGDVYGVAVVLVGRKVAAGTAARKPELKLNGVAFSWLWHYESVEYTGTFRHFEESPAGHWAASDVNNTQIGYTAQLS